MYVGQLLTSKVLKLQLWKFFPSTGLKAVFDTAGISYPGTRADFCFFSHCFATLNCQASRLDSVWGGRHHAKTSMGFLRKLKMECLYLFLPVLKSPFDWCTVVLKPTRRCQSQKVCLATVNFCLPFFYTIVKPFYHIKLSSVTSTNVTFKSMFCDHSDERGSHTTVLIFCQVEVLGISRNFSFFCTFQRKNSYNSCNKRDTMPLKFWIQVTFVLFTNLFIFKVRLHPLPEFGRRLAISTMKTNIHLTSDNSKLTQTQTKTDFPQICFISLL